MVKIVQAARENSWYLFQYGLLVVKDLINEQTWPMFVDGLVKMAQAAGGTANYFFQFGLPVVKDLINEQTWPMFVDGFIKMAQAARENSWYLFQFGLPVVKDLINEQTWPMFVDGFIKMVQATEEFSYGLFQYGLPTVKDLINEQTWPGMVKMVQAARENSWYLFQFGLPAVKDLINEINWDDFVIFFCYVGKSIHNTRRMVDVFSNLKSKTKPFLLYLIQARPKQALDILSKYRLLETLEINFKQELNLFLKIVSPVTLREKKFTTLTVIIWPIKDLPVRVRSMLLGYLDLSILTFQGVKLNFLKSLQATEGFEDISQYSFIDLVYVYLKYAQNPEIKIKKLKESISKLQKEESKILKMIANKSSL